MKHPTTQDVLIYIATAVCISAVAITAIVAFTDDKAHQPKTFLEQAQDVCGAGGIKTIDIPNSKFTCD